MIGSKRQRRRPRYGSRHRGTRTYSCGCCHPLDTDGREFVKPRATRERAALRDQGAA